MSRSGVRGPVRVAAAALLVFVLAGCQVSSLITVDAVTSSGIIRCANGRSYVMESVDDNPVEFGAATGARRDILCENEDVGLWWDLLDVTATKYWGSSICGVAPYRFTTVNRTVSTSKNSACNGGFPASRVSVLGRHGATRPGAPGPPRRELSFTPSVTSY